MTSTPRALTTEIPVSTGVWNIILYPYADAFALYKKKNVFRGRPIQISSRAFCRRKK